MAAAVFFLLDQGRPVEFESESVKEEILPESMISSPLLGDVAIQSEILVDAQGLPIEMATSSPEAVSEIVSPVIIPEALSVEVEPELSPETPLSVLDSVKEEEKILITVPFVTQAPLGHWEDPRQQDGCEEAGVLMAIAWAKGGIDTSPVAAEQAIIALADWEQENYGEHRDVYIEEVATRLFVEYFQYDQVETVVLKNKADIITALRQGKIILAPTNGQALKNPHFTSPGPERHLLVIIAYDSEKDEFITNDPGTRYGQSYRYPSDRLFEAIRAYPTGYHLPIIGVEKKVLLISK